MTWWHWALLVTVLGPLLMLGCALLALVIFFLLDRPQRCVMCQTRLPTAYRGQRYTAARCPTCILDTLIRVGDKTIDKAAGR